ncbi:MAG: DNA repair protein RadA [Deltaproteobacteria bacterium]|nr:DNA repair protein RadA [Deltaproteobacteria bacterium]MCL5277238.1 DNA repair protein RadA [Deltaproteobacteria bacterium]
MVDRGVSFVCSSCSHTTGKWLGRCPNCGEWNTLVQAAHGPDGRKPSVQAESVKLGAIATQGYERLSTGIEEFDRVLGGGIVRGALILVGGDPGIGKSTLALIAMDGLIKQGQKSLYVTGEESLQQLRLRARRLGIDESMDALAETALDAILGVVERNGSDVVVLDSIQTMESPTTAAPRGSAAQLKEITDGLMRFSKQNDVSFVIVGHVTKEGAIAGPKLLEHMVDTVLYFEGDRNMNFRILRAIKNRFGSTNEIGVFEMKETGLTEIRNPSALFLSDRQARKEGSAVFPGIEGTRALLVEIQSLVSHSYLAMPRRTAVGIDQTRLSMLIAVLDKRAGLGLGAEDIYINVVGGVSIDETASDLCVVSALASSYRRKALSADAVFIGEVGLTGEVRAVGMIEKRLKEAEKLGFGRAYVPANTTKELKVPGIELIAVKDTEALMELLFK